MNELMEWLESTFYRDSEEVTTYKGFHTERYSYSGGQQTMQLPFDVTVTRTKQVLDVQACAAFVLVVMVFLTIVTWIRGALK